MSGFILYDNDRKVIEQLGATVFMHFSLRTPSDKIRSKW